MSGDEPDRQSLGAWDWGWGRPWEKRRGWEGMSFAPGMTGAYPSMPHVGSGWGPLLERLVSLVTSRALGKQLTVRTGTHDLELTIADLEVAVDAKAVSVGQLGDVGVALESCRWGELTCEGVQATLRNTHVQAGSEPSLVAAPVELRFLVSQSDLDRLVAAHRPEVLLEISGDRVLARWQRHPEWGHVEVLAGADGTRVWLRPARVVRGRRSVSVARRLPPLAFRIGLPPERVSLVSIEARGGSVQICARLDEWRLPLSAAVPERLLRALKDARPLIDLSAWAR